MNTNGRLFFGVVAAFAFVVASAPADDAGFFKNSTAPRLTPLPPPTAAELRIKAAADKEHQREMSLLHLTKLRPGRDARNPDAPNAANYDEAKAYSRPYVSNVLRTANGKEIETAQAWWKVRRPEIAKAFESEVYGRVPANVAKVTWRVVGEHQEKIGGTDAVVRNLIGEVDNSAAPKIKVNILATETLPVQRAGKVPVVINLIYNHSYDKRQSLKGPEPPGPDWQTQILARGWGYVAYDPLSVQADDGAGLSRGIIGLTNKGRPRSLGDWGVLRAWAWGASRIVDYLQSDPRVAANEIGIAGHSRFGKTALVATAFDPRFAIAYISSAGAGGTKLMHRNYGESIENLAGEEFYWFAGNLIKYGADPLTSDDLSFDADAMIALCAPRPVFVGGGLPASGDAWVDPQGMFDAAVQAGAVYRLLGRKGLPTETMPAVETALLSGDVAFRQHRYGHFQKPNWPAFLEFAAKYWK